MKRQTKLLLSAIVGVMALSAIGTMGASAADVSASRPIVQKIAQKFGLKESDVQAVFDENRTEQLAQHQAAVKAKLDQAVTAGTITAAQEQLILDKLTELANQRTADAQTFKAMTPVQRKAAMSKERQDLLDWAKKNNIDLSKLPIVFKGFERMKGRPFVHGKI